MTYSIIKFSLLFLFFMIVSCSNNSTIQPSENGKTEPIFPIGQQVSSDNFTGMIWLEMLVTNDGDLNTHIGNVTFEPGSRSNWHYHPGGQILLATNGVGYYQERGSPIRILNKGDVIECPPNIEHWHGASPDSRFTHIAVGPNLDEGGVVWLEPVSDEEYRTPANN